MATKPPAEKISIFLTVDNNSIRNYFNSHDPALLYCRQLSYDFQNYLISSVALAKRRSVINFKIFCGVLWKPIERLIFYWNPFLKEILLFNKMIYAEVILIENEEELINYHMEHYDAA